LAGPIEPAFPMGVEATIRNAVNNGRNIFMRPSMIGQKKESI
jgi:hypothetical protein